MVKESPLMVVEEGFSCFINFEIFKSDDHDISRFYEGEWAGGVQNGQGIWFDEDENIRYEGEWKDRKFDGSGTLYWPNTADEQIKYKGEWKEVLSIFCGIFLSNLLDDNLMIIIFFGFS